MADTVEQRPRASCRVEIISGCGLIEADANRSIQVEAYRQLCAIVITRDGKTPPKYRLFLSAEDFCKETLLESGRPCQRYTRLEVILVPVVERRRMVCFARGYHRNEIVKRSPVSRCLDSLGKIVRKRNIRFYLEAFRLVHRMANGITKPSRYGQIRL